MIKSPPQEKQWLSWLYVAVWTLFIYMAIPLARTIQQYVRQEWGSDLFTYGVAAITVITLAVTVIYVRSFRLASLSSYFWLIIIAGIFFGYTIVLGTKNPEESVHFVQYGVLGVLVYRALTHRLKDATVFFAAAIICTMIGTIDEFIQWMVPRRVWGISDIWINFLSAVLVQVVVAKGLQPVFIQKGFSRKNMRFICVLTIAAVFVMGGSFLITPPRIIWLAENVKMLTFLKHNDTVMFEYGYLYKDPDIGVFRSRFTPQELKQIDRRRAVEAGKILNLFQHKYPYRLFLKIYTPITDPFVHEARVHLFRRDRYFETALKNEDDQKEYVRCMLIALRENRIMEKYFANTLRCSDYVWSEKEVVLSCQPFLQDELYDSPVSRDLVTRVRECQAAVFLLALMLGLMFLYYYLGKEPSNKT